MSKIPNKTVFYQIWNGIWTWGEENIITEKISGVFQFY